MRSCLMGSVVKHDFFSGLWSVEACDKILADVRILALTYFKRLRHNKTRLTVLLPL